MPIINGVSVSTKCLAKPNTFALDRTPVNESKA